MNSTLNFVRRQLSLLSASIVFPLVYAGGVSSISASTVLKVDFQQSSGSITEAGFNAFGCSGTAGPGPLTNTYGSITVRLTSGARASVDANGVINGTGTLMGRVRTQPSADSGVFSYNEIYRDFITSPDLATPVFSVQVQGLAPNTPYSVTLYSYDHNGSGMVCYTDITGASLSAPHGVNTPLGSLNWQAGTTFGSATSNEIYAITCHPTSDASGRLTFRVDNGCLNGLVIKTYTPPLKVDFGPSQNPNYIESGFSPFGVSNLGQGGPISNAYGSLGVRLTNGATVDSSGLLNGTGALVSRDRTQPSSDTGSFTYNYLYRDFVSASNSTNVMGLQVSGLEPSSTYWATFYSYDHNGSWNVNYTDITGATPALPNGANAPLGNISWLAGTSFGPTTPNNLYAFTACIRSDSSGRVTLRINNNPICGLVLDDARPLFETIGGGTIANPAASPQPAFARGGTGFIPVKNWNFGSDGTIHNGTVMTANFKYYDHNNSFNNGEFGALTVAADAASAYNSYQPVEGVNGVPQVRQYSSDSLKTFIVPLNGDWSQAHIVKPDQRVVGSGAFEAKWTLPGAGIPLGQDFIWETRIRYQPPKQFFLANWMDGFPWRRVEINLIESYGYDKGNGNNNWDGHAWHSELGRTLFPQDNPSDVFYGNWAVAMANQGVPAFDASKYHIWTVVYKANNSVDTYMDGIRVQGGANYHWTVDGNPAGQPMTVVYFRFDPTWGNTGVEPENNMNVPMPASELAGKFFEYDYSRVFLRPGTPVSGVYQAEACTSQSLGSAATALTGFTGAGYIDYGGNTSYVEWNNVNQSQAGMKTLVFRYSNGSAANAQCEVRVAGGLIATLPLPPTGSWANWSTVSVPNVSLLSGNNIIRVTANTANGGPNLDKMEVQ